MGRASHHRFQIALLSGLFALVAACSTPVQLGPAKPHSHVNAEGVRVADDRCEVQQFDASTELPEGSKSLGKVTVPRGASNEETIEALRKAVCEKGGDAMSNLSWVHTIGKIDGRPTDLEGTAWQLP